MVRPAGKRTVVSHMVQAHGLSRRRACRLAGLSLSTWQYTGHGVERVGLRVRLKELGYERRRFGTRRLHALLRREGWRVNHKAVHRIYVEEGLQVRRRKRKRICRAERRPMVLPQAANQRWSMDFQHDVLANGQRFRTLNIVDDFSRECPAIEVDTSLPGRRVVRVLDRLKETRGLPKAIVLDNGPEMRGLALDEWAYRNGVTLAFIDPGPFDRLRVRANPERVHRILQWLRSSARSAFRDECLKGTSKNSPFSGVVDLESG